MAAEADPQTVLLDQLDWIDRVCRAVARRNGLDSEDADDFAATVRLRLVENDCSILRRFRGESSIRTYLAVVVAMCFRDYRVARWGRWRPSAEAKRLGALAVRLETLMMRDHLALGEAGQVLRSAGETTSSDRELAALVKRLPRRVGRPTEVSFAAVEAVPSPDSPAVLTEQVEVESARLAASQALARAMERLPYEDRVIVRMRYWEGLSIADIARALDLEQKPLYRRIEAAIRVLREALITEGVSQREVREFLSWHTI